MKVSPVLANSTLTSCSFAVQSTDTYVGTSFFIPPNTIDFVHVFGHVTSLADNASVLAVLIAVFLLYLMLAVWARRQDVKDKFTVGCRDMAYNIYRHYINTV